MKELFKSIKVSKEAFAIIEISKNDQDANCRIIKTSEFFEEISKLFFENNNLEIEKDLSKNCYNIANQLKNNCIVKYINNNSQVLEFELLTLNNDINVIFARVFELRDIIDELIGIDFKNLPFLFLIVDTDNKKAIYISENYSKFIGQFQDDITYDLNSFLDNCIDSICKDFQTENNLYSRSNNDRLIIKQKLLNNLKESRNILEIGIPLLGDDKKVQTVIVMLVDLFEFEDYSNDEDNPFYIDQLTGVYNRNYLNVAIHKMNKSKYSAISIIFADIDGLKFVNDGFGHDYGDKLIMEVSSILKDSTRKSDIIVRYGGDEFIIFLPNTDVSELNHVTKRINDSINYFNNTNQLNPMRISLSIGSCTIYSDEITIDDGIKKAEDLMYTEKLKQRTNVQKTYIDAIREVLQYKEPTTNDLSEFLDELTIKLGLELKFEKDLIEMIRVLCRVNDVGKITIDTEILNKPNKLTDKEWEVLKKHPEMGYRIAMATKELSNLAEYILYHHERWDGLGYPSGLSADSIPIYSRIVAIIDSFSSMITEKPYREKLTINQAIDELRSNAGTQFDPFLVELFIKILNENSDKN